MRSGLTRAADRRMARLLAQARGLQGDGAEAEWQAPVLKSVALDGDAARAIVARAPSLWGLLSSARKEVVALFESLTRAPRVDEGEIPDYEAFCGECYQDKLADWFDAVLDSDEESARKVVPTRLEMYARYVLDLCSDACERYQESLSKASEGQEVAKNARGSLIEVAINYIDRFGEYEEAEKGRDTQGTLAHLRADITAYLDGVLRPIGLRTMQIAPGSPFDSEKHERVPLSPHGDKVKSIVRRGIEYADGTSAMVRRAQVTTE